jgi:hypothetical protein
MSERVQRERIRVDLLDLGVAMTRKGAGAQAALALAAAYRGERVVAIGFGGIRVVRDGAVSRLVRHALALLEPWADQGRLELRCLRPAVRRTILLWLASQSDLAVVARARRALVVTPAARQPHAFLGANRRKMLLLATRDGERCVWCGKSISHRSADATVDHVRCRSRGGAAAVDNLLLACAACNHRRSDRPADEWLERCLSLGLPVDHDAVVAAIHRSERLHRRRLRRSARREHQLAA